MILDLNLINGRKLNKLLNYNLIRFLFLNYLMELFWANLMQLWNFLELNMAIYLLMNNKFTKLKILWMQFKIEW